MNFLIFAMYFLLEGQLRIIPNYETRQGKMTDLRHLEIVKLKPNAVARGAVYCLSSNTYVVVLGMATMIEIAGTCGQFNDLFSNIIRDGKRPDICPLPALLLVE